MCISLPLTSFKCLRVIFLLKKQTVRFFFPSNLCFQQKALKALFELMTS